VPRYYFHLKDGRTVLDEDGTELLDIHAARKMAVTYSGEVLRDGAGESLWQGEPWRPWVTDRPGGEGKALFTLSLSAVEGEPPPENEITTMADPN
jgi:hypothetical protein